MLNEKRRFYPRPSYVLALVCACVNVDLESLRRVNGQTMRKGWWCATASNNTES